VIAELVLDPEAKRYDIVIRSNVSDSELANSEIGTVTRESRFGDAYLVHRVGGVSYKSYARRCKTRPQCAA
jgi:hypothetical protein